MEEYGLKAFLGSILHRGIGHGNPAGDPPYKRVEQVTAAFEMTRPLLAIMGTALVATGAVLSLETIPPFMLIVYGCICSAIANFYIHTFNDWSDRERDKEAWPKRAIPSGRISPRAALALSIFYFVLAITLTGIFFNITTAIILTVSLSLGTLYTTHLRDKAGYLILPFIVGIHPVGGWAAFSPHTLFKSPLPWILYALIFLWQAGHIMVHSTLHPVIELRGRNVTQIKGLFFSTTPRQAAVLGFIFLMLTSGVSIYLYFVAPLNHIYLTVAILSAFYALIPSAMLIKDPENKKRAMNAFNAVSLYALILCLSVIVDILVYKVLWEYVLGFFSLIPVHHGWWLLPLAIAAFATLIGFIFLGIFALDRIIKTAMKRKKPILGNR
jgi:4-hydroxybenzoate polyprenyltransferase